MDSRMERILAKQKEREELMRKKEEERKQKENQKKAKVLQVFKAGRDEPETITITSNKPTLGENPEALDTRMSELRWERKEGTWAKRNTQTSTVQTSAPQTSSLSALENKIGELRWKKTAYGWSRQDEKYQPYAPTPTVPAVESSKEVNCYQTSVTSSYLPRNVYEALGISGALQRRKDFISACKILSDLIAQWFLQPSSLAVQNLMFNDLVLANSLLYCNSDYMNAICYRAAAQLMGVACKTLECLIKKGSNSEQLEENGKNVKEKEAHHDEELAKLEKQQGGWKCTVCTFFNVGDHDICMMCDRDRVLIMKEKAKRELSLQDEQKWKDKDREMEEMLNIRNKTRYTQVSEWLQRINESLQTQFDIKMPTDDFQFNLPYEVVFMIVSFLTDEVDLVAAQQVCKWFHKIASDEVIYKLLLMRKHPKEFELLNSSKSHHEINWKDAFVFTYKTKKSDGAVQCIKCGSVVWRQARLCTSCSAVITQSSTVPLNNAVSALLMGTSLSRNR